MPFLLFSELHSVFPLRGTSSVVTSMSSTSWDMLVNFKPVSIRINIHPFPMAAKSLQGYSHIPKQDDDIHEKTWKLHLVLCDRFRSKRFFAQKMIGDTLDEYSQLRWAESQTRHSCLCLHFIRLSVSCRKTLYILTLKWLSYPCASCVTILIATLKDTQMSAHDKLMTLHYRSLEPHADRQLFTMRL